MTKFFGVLVLCLAFSTTHAQLPDDALRTAWYIPGGSARNMAIGGAMGSLGGDISAANINPAGIGLYKTSEFIISPGVMLNSNKLKYFGIDSSSGKNAFSYGSSGFIFGNANPNRSNRTSSAFAITFTQLASYNNHVAYRGINDYSSYSEQYLEELVRDGASPIAAEQNYIFGSSLAYRTYLIDSVNINGQFTGYKSLVPVGTGIIQEKTEDTKGGMHEISFAFAGNTEDKLYLGASINIPFLSYKRDLFYRETDATKNPNNNFDFSEFTENFSSSGVGINAKMGLIYKATKQFRLGFALHTPSFMSMKDKIRASMSTNTEGYTPYGTLTESSDNLNGGNAGERTYTLQTPWRAIGSLSFVFSETADTKKQRGFITADLEYVNYRGARFYSADANDETGVNYYTTLNDVIKDVYKGALNFRAGGEIKFDPLMLRLGAAYYGSPYYDKQLKTNRMMFSAGAGYRRHGFIIDLTYAYTINKDVNLPYRLNDKANTYAEWTNNRGNIILTFGVKI